jgi:glycosyltransferase involved in cell wall biosynthesis
MKIQWTTAIVPNKSEGYSDAAGYLKNNLKKDFSIIEHNATSPVEEDSAEVGKLASMGIGIFYEKSEKDVDIYIHNTLPILFNKKNGYNVCFTYWETSRIPYQWLDVLNSADEVWTTSRWAREVFINSGVQIPVYDFKLGINDQIYTLPDMPRKLAREPFTFLCIGSPSTRKNSQIAVNAFLKLFGHDERFKLIYKSNGPPDARIYNDTLEMKMMLSEHPRIEVIDWQVSESDLASIYKRSDCVLYPTSGEGWGLLPVQGIALGIPTICTNATACTEFAHLSVPLGFKWGSKNMTGIYEGCGEWAEPDFDDLCDKMLYVVNNYDEVALNTFDGAKYVHKNFTWEKVSIEYKERLCQISNKLSKKV